MVMMIMMMIMIIIIIIVIIIVIIVVVVVIIIIIIIRQCRSKTIYISTYQEGAFEEHFFLEKQEILQILILYLQPYLYKVQGACAVLYCYLWRVPMYHIFSYYLIKDKIFGKKIIGPKIFLLNIHCKVSF